MKTDAALIIVGGGGGRRFGGGSKLFAPLGGEPVFIHAMRRLGPFFPDGARIMVVPAAELERFRRTAAARLPELPFMFVPGGDERADSVRAGLARLPEQARYAAIHDAARPLVPAGLLDRVLTRARETGGAIPGRAVVDTLKRVGEGGVIRDTVPRENLFRVETPQCFEVARLLAACRATAGRTFTDDAAVMEAAGFPVAVVEHAEENPKLTYAADLEFLEFLLARPTV